MLRASGPCQRERRERHGSGRGGPPYERGDLRLGGIGALGRRLELGLQRVQRGLLLRKGRLDAAQAVHFGHRVCVRAGAGRGTGEISAGNGWPADRTFHVAFRDDLLGEGRHLHRGHARVSGRPQRATAAPRPDLLGQPAQPRRQRRRRRKPTRHGCFWGLTQSMASTVLLRDEPVRVGRTLRNPGKGKPALYRTVRQKTRHDGGRVPPRHLV